MMGDAVKLRRASALPFQKLNDEILVVNPGTREVHLLNPTATRIWELLESDRTAADLVTSLLAEYDADKAQVGKDVDALLTDLTTKGLIGQADTESGKIQPSKTHGAKRPPSRGR